VRETGVDNTVEQYSTGFHCNNMLDWCLKTHWSLLISMRLFVQYFFC